MRLSPDSVGIPQDSIPLTGADGFVVFPTVHGLPGDAAAGVGTADETLVVQFVLPYRVEIQLLRVFLDTKDSVANKKFGIGIYDKAGARLFHTGAFEVGSGATVGLLSVVGSVDTTLDGSAASGQKVIPLTATTNIIVGANYKVIGSAGSETIEVASIVAGVSVTAVDNLTFSYVSTDTFKNAVQILNRGVYFIAWTSESTIAFLRGISFSSDATLTEMMNAKSTKKVGTVTGGSAGIVPATLGTITGVDTITECPVLFAEQ